jgi:mono/diheme cytochrome c family protein
MRFKIFGILALAGIGLFISCQSDDQLEFDHYYSGGNVIYQSKCQNCHGIKGEGLLALIPPLTDSVYLKTNKELLACYIKYGVHGKINVTQKQFEGTMPANNLAAVEIAEVLTYITNSFGNKIGIVTTAQINDDLNKCK